MDYPMADNFNGENIMYIVNKLNWDIAENITLSGISLNITSINMVKFWKSCFCEYHNLA